MLTFMFFVYFAKYANYQYYSLGKHLWIVLAVINVKNTISEISRIEG